MAYSSDPYSPLYDLIEEHTDTLYETVSTGFTNSQELLSKFATSQHALYDALHKYYRLQRPRDFEAPYDDNRFEDLLCRCVQKLQSVMIEFYDSLFVAVSCSRAIKGGSGVAPRVYPSNMLFYVITKMMLCITQYQIARPDDPDENQNEIRPSDFIYVTDNKLMMHDKPILQMSVRELFDSIKALQCRWNTLLYDQQLVLYVEMLEYRTAQLLHETWPSYVHDLDEYRKPVMPSLPLDATEQQKKLTQFYMFNEKFLWFVSGMFIEMRTRISHHKIGTHVECPAKWFPSDEQLDVIKLWFKKRAESTFADHITTMYRKEYLKQIIRPGERVEFMAARPGAVITEQQIYNQVRGREATQRIQEFCGSRRDTEPLKDDERLYPESACTMASTLLTAYFSGEYPSTNWSRYYIPRSMFKHRHMEFPRERGPFLVQSFNFFNVFFDGEVLVTNGFYNAFGCFLNIIEKEFHGSIENGKLLLFALFESIYGIEKGLQLKLQWQNQNLRGCQNIVADGLVDGEATMESMEITGDAAYIEKRRKDRAKRRKKRQKRKKREPLTEIVF